MRILRHALLSSLALFTACDPALEKSASEGTTAARCSGQPVVTQADGGVFITYCGATTYTSAAQLAGHIPWARGQR